jgi:hypothetical protein
MNKRWVIRKDNDGRWCITPPCGREDHSLVSARGMPFDIVLATLNATPATKPIIGGPYECEYIETEMR